MPSSLRAIITSVDILDIVFLDFPGLGRVVSVQLSLLEDVSVFTKTDPLSFLRLQPTGCCHVNIINSSY